jgi:transcriptional regulator with XRE-family HTH domain
MDQDHKSLGEIVRNRREGKHLSRRALAMALGIAPSSLGRIEDGYVVVPKKSTLEGLRRELGIETAEFPTDGDRTAPRPRTSDKALQGLRAEEERALVEYLEFLRWRASRRSGVN